MAKTRHYLGNKLKDFRVEHVAFKPIIGDFLSGFWGIRINMHENAASGYCEAICLWMGPRNRTRANPIKRSYGISPLETAVDSTPAAQATVATDDAKRAVVSCPNCDGKFRLPSGRKGTVHCPHCKKQLAIQT